MSPETERAREKGCSGGAAGGGAEKKERDVKYNKQNLTQGVRKKHLPGIRKTSKKNVSAMSSNLAIVDSKSVRLSHQTLHTTSWKGLRVKHVVDQEHDTCNGEIW